MIIWLVLNKIKAIVQKRLLVALPIVISVIALIVSVYSCHRSDRVAEISHRAWLVIQPTEPLVGQKGYLTFVSRSEKPYALFGFTILNSGDSTARNITFAYSSCKFYLEGREIAADESKNMPRPIKGLALPRKQSFVHSGAIQITHLKESTLETLNQKFTSLNYIGHENDSFVEIMFIVVYQDEFSNKEHSIAAIYRIWRDRVETLDYSEDRRYIHQLMNKWAKV